MSLDLLHLDARTRQFMLAELEADRAARTLHYSSQLTEAGAQRYRALLQAALESGTEASFAETLAHHDAIRPPNRWQHAKDIGPAEALADATFRLAEREFHRFYIRGLCCRALAQGVEHW